MNLIITGVHGFVGSNLTKALRKNNDIYGLDIVAPEKDGVIHTFSWADLENHSLPDSDAIIHLAGKAHDTRNQSNAQVYFDVNTKLTQKVYDYFLSSSAQKFIFFSSVKAAADTVLGNILTEDVIPNPKGPYGESKIRAEQYIQNNWPPSDSGKSIYILRPCMIHGPGNKGNLNLLYNIIKRGIPWPLGAFENRRSYCSIENICYVIDRLIKGCIASGIYHISDDEAIATNELIELMCKTLNKKPKIWNLSKNFMTGIARLGGTFHLPLNPQTLQKLTENYIVSNEKIKTALGIGYLPISAQEGLSRTFKSFRR
ncbi:MAG: NAD-dependent epimerase/dehydratase family protein [Prolixibacteraceae bacterium]